VTSAVLCFGFGDVYGTCRRFYRFGSRKFTRLGWRYSPCWERWASSRSSTNYTTQHMPLSATGSDPNDAMAYPFALTNNSHFFTLREISWKCYVVKLISKDGRADIENTDLNRGSTLDARPGNSINFSCFGKKALTPMWVEGPFAIGEVLISVYYSTSIGKRSVENVRFTWEGETSNPQWIRGDYADDHPAPARP
jgi:hypothetical protein